MNRENTKQMKQSRFQSTYTIFVSFREDIQEGKSSGFGLSTFPPSHHGITHGSGLLEFRSHHGCGTAGDSHPTSFNPSMLVDKKLQ